MKLGRVLTMAPEELADRARQEAWKRLYRLGPVTRRGWRPERVLEELASGPATKLLPGHPRASRRVSMVQLVRDRSLDDLGARFFPGALADETPKLVWQHTTGAAAEVLRVADAAREGRFDLLGYRGLRFGDPIDWRLDPVAWRRSLLVHWSRLDPLDHRQVGDSKVVWELGRQQWVVHLAQAYRLTGDTGYARSAVDAILAWLDGNPPGLGIHWASSLELAFRLLSWAWTLALCRDADAMAGEAVLRVLDGVDRHARHIVRHLSRYFSPNTHLTGEALGLFAAGVAFPSLRRAARWRDLGARILVSECPRQILPDGIEFERATCYQRYTVEIYLHFLILAAHNGIPVPVAVPDRVQRCVDALLWLRAPDGSLLPVGDADGGWLFPQPGRTASDVRGVLGLAAAHFGRPDYAWAAGGLVPEALWLLGPEALRSLERLVPAPPTESPSRVFPDGGLVVMRSGWDSEAHQLVLDVGPLGDPVSGGHGHADLLAVQVAAFGVPVVIDPGTGCYTAAPHWREHFRSSHAHSTVAVDSRSQAAPAGPFAWKSRPAARLLRAAVPESVAIAEGEHEAYSGLADPVRHRRRVLFVGRHGWIIVDDLTGRAEHAIEVRFQLAPLPVTTGPDGWTRVRTDGARGLLIRAFAAIPLASRIVEGTRAPLEGWVSPDYGVWRPAPALVYSVSTRLPLRVVTVLWPTEAIDAPAPTVTIRPDVTGTPAALTIGDAPPIDLAEAA